MYHDTELIVRYYEAKQEAYELRQNLRDVQLALLKEKKLVQQLVHVMYCTGLDPNKVIDLYDSLQLVEQRPRFHPPDRLTEFPWVVRKRFAYDGWKHFLVPSDISPVELDLKGKRSAGSGPRNFSRSLDVPPVPPLPPRSAPAP